MTRSNCLHRSILFKSTVLGSCVLGACTLAMLVTINNVHAEDMPTAVKRGNDLWRNPTLGRNGLTCDNCHPNSSATHPQSWPRYQINLSKVGTLREMMNWCINVSMLGKSLLINSDEMDDLEAYANYMHRNDAIDIANNKPR